jgi:hypothetical protein
MSDYEDDGRSSASSEGSSGDDDEEESSSSSEDEQEPEPRGKGKGKNGSSRSVMDRGGRARDDAMNSLRQKFDRVQRKLKDCEEKLYDKTEDYKRLEQVVRTKDALLCSRPQKYGRNNLSREGWGGSDITNLDNLNKFCKTELWPYYKFLPENWQQFTPNVTSTVCRHAMYQIKVPKTFTDEYYWEHRAVSIINKKYVEMRGNYNSALRVCYMSM